jgi:hypothetical protein
MNAILTVMEVSKHVISLKVLLPSIRGFTKWDIG